MSTSSNNWNDNIEKILNDIRLNCNDLEKHHSRLYFSIKNIVVYFKLPIIILSSLNAIIAVAMTSYIDQSYISAMNCFISFFIGVLTSISLYLKIEDRLENELLASKEYHKLSIEIFRVLSLKTCDRGVDGDQFLNNMYNEYVKLFDRSNLSENEFNDRLKDNLLPNLLSIKINSTDDNNII